MFKHLFKLIWNKKKQNLLLISEMLISFLVMFAVFTLVVYFFNNYKKPMGFEYDDVWVVNFQSSLQTENHDSLNMFYENMRAVVKSLPEVKEASFCSGNVILSQSHAQGTVQYNGKEVSSVNMFRVEDDYARVLNMKLVEGRWFNKGDVAAKDKPIVINETLREKLFGAKNAAGVVIGYPGTSSEKMKIIGVVQDVKAQGNYAEAGSALYNRSDSALNFGNMLLKMSPGSDATVEGKLYKTMAKVMRDSNVEIEHLDDKRKKVNLFALVPMIVLSIVAFFLITNVALGLFGVLWYNINKRRGEIGLRRAIGASGNSVSSQLVAETLILATFSLIVGTFFAIQFPLLNVFDLPSGVYITAIIFAILFIYLLVFICSLYPGRQAAAIYPAVALHEE